MEILIFPTYLLLSDDADVLTFWEKLNYKTDLIPWDDTYFLLVLLATD